MGFKTNEIATVLQKALAGSIFDGDSLAQWYEANLYNHTTVSGNKVWLDMPTLETLPADSLVTAKANAASNATLIQDLSSSANAVRLTPVKGTNNTTYVAYTTYDDESSEVIGNWIQPSMIPQDNGLASNGYAIRLFAGGREGVGTEIMPADFSSDDRIPAWIFNYSIGGLILSPDIQPLVDSLGSDDLYIQGFRYTGLTPSTATSSSIESWELPMFDTTNVMVPSGIRRLTNGTGPFESDKTFIVPRESLQIGYSGIMSSFGAVPMFRSYVSGRKAVMPFTYFSTDGSERTVEVNMQATKYDESTTHPNGTDIITADGSGSDKITFDFTTSALAFESLIFRVPAGSSVSNFRFRMRVQGQTSDFSYWPTRADYENSVGTSYDNTAGTDAYDLTLDFSNAPLLITQGSLVDLYYAYDGELLGNTATKIGVAAMSHNIEFKNLALQEEIITADERSLLADVDSSLTDLSERTGFINHDATLSFANDTRLFTITPDATVFEYYIKGRKYSSGTKTLTLPDTTGQYHIYVDISGVLTYASDFDIDTMLKNNCYICNIFWDAAESKALHFGEERHSANMHWSTHDYLHQVLGTQFVNGLGFTGFDVDKTTITDDNAKFSYESGAIRDEDLYHPITAASSASIPIFYRQGTEIKVKDADEFAVIYNGDTTSWAGDTIAYNTLTGSSWALSALPTGKFMMMFYYATNDKLHSIAGWVGTQQYDTVADAVENAANELATIAPPFNSYLPIGAVIWSSDATYTTTPKAVIESTGTGSYIDFRMAKSVANGISYSTTHATLLGRDLPDQHSISSITGLSDAINSAAKQSVQVINSTAVPSLLINSSNVETYGNSVIIINNNTGVYQVTLDATFTTGSQITFRHYSSGEAASVLITLSSGTVNGGTTYKIDNNTATTFVAVSETELISISDLDQAPPQFVTTEYDAAGEYLLKEAGDAWKIINLDDGTIAYPENNTPYINASDAWNSRAVLSYT